MNLGISLKSFLNVDDFVYLTISIWSPEISAIIMAALTGGRPIISKILRGFTIWRVNFRWYLESNRPTWHGRKKRTC